MDRTEKTVRGWIQQYSESGFKELKTIKSGGNNTKILSEKAKDFIANKLSDSTILITSYIELQLLIASEIEEIVSYFVLYAHCKQNHK
ncbi:helix-turn-helix domain-containing protein [Aquimarina longa]|uniref:helix-turn-helix domain-containing protein n=1 Tax=Aquimarina longa TaxID=1080221 RepID=UPI00078573D5|nr:helix-turn-helix domain-containing protein [Aquimarina longa]